MRVGLGYDIHRIATGRPLVLGGVTFDSEFGLDGHSDADVLLHALMDALLGAASLGDIGEHFPPSDARFRGISSVLLLERVGELLTHKGYAVVNVDMVLIAERPRIRTQVAAMRKIIANTLQISTDDVGIKATTNERVGPEGRGEAMSAHAVALLQRSV